MFHHGHHIFRRTGRLIVGPILLVLAAVPAQAETVNLTLLLVNDIDKMEGAGPRGGFARLAGVVEQERAKGGHLLYVHAGDTLSPSLMSGFDHGRHVIELLNIAPPDVFVPGNHEFDFGPDVFRQRMSEAKFPLFAANLQGPDGKPLPGFAATKVFEFGGVKVGVVGLAADDSQEKSSPGDLVLLPTVKTGIAEAGQLRKNGADLVIAVAHAARSKDRALFDSRAADVILSADDHDLNIFFDGKTLLAESKEQAEFVTAIDLAIDVEEENGRRSVTWWPNFRLIDTANVEPSAAAAAKTKELEAQLSKELDVAIGTTQTPLDSRRPTVRGGEAAIGNLIADAMRAAIGADIAIVNGGGIRGNKEYPAGTGLLRRDVLTELPFGNKTVLVEVTGATLLAALENGVAQVEEGAGRFPQVSGLTMQVDLKKPGGSRVVAVEVAGKPLDRQATYRLATNDFMLRGGDGYTMLAEGNVILGELDGTLLADHVMSYIAKAGTIAPKVEGRVKLVQ
ncbi:bifunctional metallophosphatase/5'-nucleotidase [Dongia deserti]|uniref:bifunctional metallophosphatase/5'-nucleotidase n=1 Tax=Dongia deserti TaxID=2268030 RepID=UPI000E649D09|nr:5'-nucleotidase C-terminal domain-containing protein [Dongia deserti]